MVWRQTQLFAALQAEDADSSSTARPSPLLPHRSPPLLVEGDDRGSQDLDWLPVPVARNHGGASANALAHAPLSRHDDELVLDAGHALGHFHALAHRRHDVRGNLGGLEFFGHAFTGRDAESDSRGY